MARADNTYSRVVAGMISNTIDPSDPVPTAPIDLEQRAQDLGVTRPSFAGVTGRGDEIALRADAARPERGAPERLMAERVTGEIGLVGGAGVRLRSATARLDQGLMTATLEGTVHISTTTGYEIDTDRLDTRLDALYAESPGPVSATGPLGALDAGRMILREAPGTEDAELLFSGGVKLVYRPNIEEERDQ